MMYNCYVYCMFDVIYRDYLTYDRHGEMINDNLRTKLLTDTKQMDPITQESNVYSLTMSNM